MSISKDKLSAMQSAFSDQSNVFADAIKSSENVDTKVNTKETNKDLNNKANNKANKNINRKTSKPKKRAKRKSIKMPVATKDNKVIKSYSLEPAVADKIADLAKKQGFKNASAFVNAVFKQA